MAAAGGVLATSAPPGLIFVGVAAGGAAIAFELPVAVALATAGPAVRGRGSRAGRAPGPAALGGRGEPGCPVSGTGRRQMAQRARQQTLIATARERADVVRREAELVSERNRLGRELHDVLAHTLGALSIQLTALDTQVQTGAGRDELRTEIQRSHELVGEGLDEARRGGPGAAGRPHAAGRPAAAAGRPARGQLRGGRDPAPTAGRAVADLVPGDAGSADQRGQARSGRAGDGPAQLRRPGGDPHGAQRPPGPGPPAPAQRQRRWLRPAGHEGTGPAGRRHLRDRAGRDGWQVTVSIPADRP